MKEIIYSKFSNDRNENYKIRTDIYNDNGKKSVAKCGVTEGGKKHIENVFHMYTPLKEQTKNTIFDVNRSTLINGELSLEYIEGDNLEKILDALLEHEEFEKFKELVGTYVENIRKMASEEFEPSKEYYEIFGDEALDIAGKSMQLSNIDLIFPNVIVKEDKWTIIDFEWSFPISIPVDFILFRTLHYYALPNRFKLLKDIDMYVLMGIDEEQKEIFEKMEANFQKYIISGNKPLWKLYEQMGQPFYNMPEIAENKKYEQIRVVQVNEFNESVICKQVNYKKENDITEVHFKLDGQTKILSVYPGQKKCILKIIAFEGIQNSDYSIDYFFNGKSYEDGIIFFDEDNPYLMTDKVKENTKEIVLKYKLLCIDGFSDEIDNIISTYEKKNELIQEIDELKNELIQSINKLRDEDYKVIVELQNKIDNIENSRSWKITKPLRSIKKPKR